jgi:coenzyme PQQ precursor peptide PqqA
MTDTVEQPKQPAGTIAEQADKTPWQTPGYTVVDTALEVTAYSLSTR